MLQHLTATYLKADTRQPVTVPLSYEVFGLPLQAAPVVLVNHALTGNSAVAGDSGWWKSLVGSGKVIDTEKYSVLCFNIPGNGYDGFFIEDFEQYSTKIIAEIFLEGLKTLGIEKLHALVGGSIGGAVGWEMLALKPDLAERFFPIATDYKCSDWLHAQCLVQKFLLESADKPLEKARIHAMLCYRTPESLNLRFQKEIHDEKQILKSHDWLNYHGDALSKRFSLKAYHLMNHLLMTIDAPLESLKNITAEIHLVAVDTDLFFPAFEIKNAFNQFKDGNKIHYHEIKSIHGHDAFLMEYEQLNHILKPFFNHES